MTIMNTATNISDQPCGATWYVVVPDGIDAIQRKACYAGPNRVLALDRVVALLAQGIDVNAGERFRRSQSDAYVSVGTVRHIGDRPLVVPDADAEDALLDEARDVLGAEAEDCTPYDCGGVVDGFGIVHSDADPGL